MKTRNSMKYTRNYDKVFTVGYSQLQNLLKLKEPTYYNAGVYGWNNDGYVFPEYDIVITTGYRNTRGGSIESDKMEAYDKKAREILSSYMDWDVLREKMDILLDEFLRSL